MPKIFVMEKKEKSTRGCLVNVILIGVAILVIFIILYIIMYFGGSYMMYKDGFR